MINTKKVSAEDYMLSEEVLNIPKTPRPINFNAVNKYKNKMLFFAMNASIEVTKGGRLYSAWIGGEDAPEAYMIVTYSDDFGNTWKDIQFVIDPKSDDIPYSLNTHIGGLWRDPKDRLWLFYQQSLGMWDGAGANFAIVCDNPDAKNPVWSKPTLISPGASIKKPIVLSSGEWILPVSVWERWHISPPLEDCHHEYDSIRGANAFISTDEGKTWNYQGGVIFENSSFNEHSIVELKDGRLMMNARCATAQKRSFSADKGKTWTNEEIYFNHANSMATIRRLRSGRLLLIKHGTTMEHVTEKRSHLSAFLSEDDGKTWSNGLLLDERVDVSYPDVCQADDGTIFVQYDYLRYEKAEILFARFTEEDILAGEIVSDGSALCQIIKAINGIKGTKNTLFEGASDSFSGGNGTKENPYTISAPNEFKYLAKSVYEGNNFEGVYFSLSNDIDFNGKELIPVGLYITPEHSHPFSGIFDGNNHYLYNFKISGAEVPPRAPFSYLLDGTICNVKIKNANINGKTSVASVVGFAKGTEEKGAVIDNCYADDSVSITAYEKIGGIVGSTDGNVQIRKCTNQASIHIPRTTGGLTIYTGGIVGFTSSDTSIASCINEGTINSKYANEICVGGIAGGTEAKKIIDCENKSTVTLDMTLGHAFIAGIGGKYDRSTEFINCTDNGKLICTNSEHIHIEDIANFFDKEVKDDESGN